MQLPLTLQACRRIFSEISLDMHQCRIGPLHSLKMTICHLFSYDTPISLQKHCINNEAKQYFAQNKSYSFIMKKLYTVCNFKKVM